MIPTRPRIRFLRFAVGSGLATLTSAIAFALVYRAVGAGPLWATGVAFVSGAAVNFAAARFWAWQRRGRSGLGRETLSYLLVSLVGALAASGVTTLTHTALLRSGSGVDPDTRTILVEGSYFATYAALFLVKFVVLDRLVFRSRHQVPTTTRA